MDNPTSDRPIPATAGPLAGKRILISGGTTGIGRATLALLAAAGARPFTFGREEAPLRDALRHAGLDPADGMTADVVDPAALDRVFAQVDERLGGIDILVACAALGARPLHEMPGDEWRYVVETNLVGYLAATRAALDRMLPQGGGHIVLVSSISPEIKAPGESVYAATKGGINAFALTLRKEVADRNVRISVIEPGSVNTDMQECSDDDKRAAIARAEMLHAHEIAEAIEFVLTRSPHCDVSVLRMEPLRQKTA